MMPGHKILLHCSMALFEYNIHNHVDLSDIEKEIKRINLKLNNMPTKEEYRAVMNEITTAIDNIGDDITRLTDQLATGGMSDADEQEVFEELRALGERAKALAARTPETETPTEPTPE